jgi:hypothetical protein
MTASSQLDAQSCIDTIQVKGYYIIQRSESEVNPVIKRNKHQTTIEHPLDLYSAASFIPCDSISRKYPMSYWLNNFYKSTSRVFISCERIDLKYLVESCKQIESNNVEKCSFPVLKSSQLYRTANANTGDVFEIYYMEAMWAKTKVNKESVEASMIPSRISQVAISPQLKTFDLYYFVKCETLKLHPKITDRNVKVWNNPQQTKQ